MNLRHLEDWVAHCDRLRSTPRSDAIVGSGWMVSMSTPPPSLQDPLERIPLDRARELREQTGSADGRGDRERLEEALAWLEHPHPATSPAVRRLIGEERARVQETLEAIAARAHPAE